MIRRTAVYGVFIAVVAAAVWWRDGANRPEPGNLVAALLLVPLFAYVIWLRWDWAPEENRRKQGARKEREKGGATTGRSASPDVTDAAERP